MINDITSFKIAFLASFESGLIVSLLFNPYILYNFFVNFMLILHNKIITFGLILCYNIINGGKIMISNNFSTDDIIGTNNFSHFIVIICFFSLAFILADKLSKKSNKTINITVILCSLYVVICEIIKMIYRYITVGTFRYVFPMPFCFLFIPAILIYLINNEKIKHFALTFLCSGSLMGGALYIFVPNGSIDKYPIYHVNAIHGLSFHFIMVLLALIFLKRKMYVPNIKDYKYYFMFMGVSSIIALILNSFSGGNALFFGNDSGIPFLKYVIEKSRVLHILIVFFGESVILFFIFYVIYSIIMNLNIKIRKEVQNIHEH